MTPLELANSYVSQGLKVFPCRSRAEETIDQYTGEVTTLGEKTPLTSNGFRGATRFAHIVKRWFADWPDAAVGLPTGKEAGFFVLDIDNKPGGANGFEWLAEMEAEHGPLPETARVSSPNGGMHYFFKYIDGARNRGNLGAGADLRGQGGYVVAAGSVMSDGRAYRWVDQPDADKIPPIADAPDWLLSLVIRREQPSTHQPSGTAHTNSAYVNAAVDRELAGLASAPMGSRNNSLNDSAFCLGTFVGAGALAESEARALLQDVARGWGRDWARCQKTIENGLAAGRRSPRDIPKPEQDNTRLVDISRMIENGLRKAAAKASRADTPIHNNISESNIDIENDIKDAPQAAAAAPTITATPFIYKDPRTLPRREFAFGTHYIRKYVSVTVAPGGLGKTANSIVEALAMVTGRPLAGTKPPYPLRVWLFNSEDPRDELERRIMAACIKYKISAEDINGRLFLDTGREQELVIAKDDKKGVRIVEPVVEAIVNQIEANQIDVKIVDPFVSTHQVNENDNGAIDKVAKLWAQIADRTNCAIDIVHHLRKLADREATVEDARGAVALIGAARSVRVLNRMSSEQAKEAGIGETERYGYFNINHGKANLTPLSNKLDWRRLDGVPLGNGQGMTKPQDFAPVVTEWKWPSAEEVASRVTPEQRERIVSLLAGQSYKAARQAKEAWAGIAVMAAMDMDPDDKASAGAAGSILKALLSEGVLKVEERRDERSRTNLKFVVAA